jgi:dGTPase
MLSLRTFMFERVYLGPVTRPEHERARATVRRIFDSLAERGDAPDAITEFIAGMTDRFALAYAERLD